MILIRVKEFSMGSPKNVILFYNSKDFREFVTDESTIFIDSNGTAYGENEMHIYVCEHYEDNTTKKRKRG